MAASWAPFPNAFCCSMYGRMVKAQEPVWSGARAAGGREELVRGPKIEDASADLLEVVGALGPVGRLAHSLHGRQQQPDQDGNDGDGDQQLNQRETGRFTG